MDTLEPLKNCKSSKVLNHSSEPKAPTKHSKAASNHYV